MILVRESFFYFMKMIIFSQLLKCNQSEIVSNKNIINNEVDNFKTINKGDQIILHTNIYSESFIF
mgnify:CR=1 FL=1